MVDSEIKDFSLFAPKNIQLIPKTIFKIILSLKKEIRNRVFSLNAISHDLKTPLTKAKLLIENKYSDNSLILKYFDDIEYLFSQISTYNKKCNKKVEATKTDIVNFVECLCEDYEVDDCVNFSSSIEEGIVYIQIKEMKRAFSNIINNSIKYAGCVDIFISRKENFIEVTFTDTGPGIKETDLNKIWQPFFRSDVARNSDIPGTGLGLCIVKKIFEANNVQVFIENNKPHGLKVTTKFKDQA
ncbi:sensor histidine kinase [Francisella sp. TX07-6608]|uniref:sensor histidine kinase n=1 Tax=Francisella sp. TX07-6608 TaxID=573568 RepID=UPI001F19AE10|nr:HAMP domain-containing sensor histidine kinase [Francisella sp. TX07-6608]